MRLVAIVALALLALALVAFVGLRIEPRPLADFAVLAGTPATVALPEGLPVPVAAFYGAVYGDAVPVLTSAVISGRGRMSVRGISFPLRFRFTHQAGDDYRHYFELTWFGLPILRANEWFLSGNARLELPFGVTDGEPKVNQAANLSLWAESIWLPAAFLGDTRVRWEDLDDQSAVLIVPAEDGEESFVMRFDEATKLLTFAESMRYREADSERKSLWLNEVREWGSVDGHTLPVVAAVTWHEDGAPWLVLRVESIVYNADVSDYVRSRGP